MQYISKTEGMEMQLSNQETKIVLSKLLQRCNNEAKIRGCFVDVVYIPKWPFANQKRASIGKRKNLGLQIKGHLRHNYKGNV